jgi:hypothetical protein
MNFIITTKDAILEEDESSERSNMLFDLCVIPDDLQNNQPPPQNLAH